MKKTILFAAVAIAASSCVHAQVDLLAGMDFTNQSAANYTDLPDSIPNDGSAAAAYGSFILSSNIPAMTSQSGLDVGNATARIINSDNRAANFNNLFDTVGGGFLAEDFGLVSADGEFFEFAVNTSSVGIYQDFTFAFGAGLTEPGSVLLDISFDSGSGSVSLGQYTVNELLASSGNGEAVSFNANVVTDSIIFRVGFNDISTGTGIAFDNIQVSGTAVPEPSACAAILGVVALGFVACRRRVACKRLSSKFLYIPSS